MRIKGIGGILDFEAAGVDTVPELSKRNGDNLSKRSLKLMVKNLFETFQTKKQILNWIEQAKKLPRAIQY